MSVENKAKRVAESKSVMTEMVMPNDANPMGNLMGGNLLRWMDIISSICALDFSRYFKASGPRKP